MSTLKRDTMKNTVLDSAFRVMLLKMGYSLDDMRYIFNGGNHARV